MKPIGAVVIILDRDNKVLILKRPKWVQWGSSQWAFPGGKLEEGENPEEAAIRETREETSLKINNLQRFTATDDVPVISYWTRSYQGEIKIDHEHDEWTWVDRDGIEKYNLAPQVLEMYDWVLNHGK